MAFPIVFFDIAGPDTAQLTNFYLKVFGWQRNEHGNFNIGAVNPLPGTLRTRQSEKRIYIGVPDVTASLELVKEHGGSVDAPRFEVPGVVVLGLFKDPAGNHLGLVDMVNGNRKIPE